LAERCPQIRFQRVTEVSIDVLIRSECREYRLAITMEEQIGKTRQIKKDSFRARLKRGVRRLG